MHSAVVGPAGTAHIGIGCAVLEGGEARLHLDDEEGDSYTQKEGGGRQRLKVHRLVHVVALAPHHLRV